MSSRKDQAYHAMRAEQERRLAAEAADPKIAELHMELAARYAELADEGRGKTLSVRTG